MFAFLLKLLLIARTRLKSRVSGWMVTSVNLRVELVARLGHVARDPLGGRIVRHADAHQSPACMMKAAPQRSHAARRLSGGTPGPPRALLSRPYVSGAR